MTKTEIFSFLKANPVCHVATVEDGKPHTRGLAMHKADKNGIIFQTWKMKDIHRQLTKNPETELCFNSKEAQVRISGQMELMEDLELKKEIEEKRPFMTPIIAKHGGYDSVAIYRLKSGKAHIWTMATNLDPKNYIDL